MANEPGWDEGRIDDLLRRCSAAGEQAAKNELFMRVYEELRRRARFLVSKLPPGQTMQATDLVHQVYFSWSMKPGAVEVNGEKRREWASMRHFVNAAALAMERLLGDIMRHKQCLKMGGKVRRSELNEDQAQRLEDLAQRIELEFDAIKVSDALHKLMEWDPECAEVVRLHFFAALSRPRIAELMGLTIHQVRARWDTSKAFLSRQLASVGAFNGEK